MGPAARGGTGRLVFPMALFSSRRWLEGLTVAYSCAADPPAKWFLLERGGSEKFVSHRSLDVLMVRPVSCVMAGSCLPVAGCKLFQLWLPSSLR